MKTASLSTWVHTAAEVEIVAVCFQRFRLTAQGLDFVLVPVQLIQEMGIESSQVPGEIGVRFADERHFVIKLFDPAQARALSRRLHDEGIQPSRLAKEELISLAARHRGALSLPELTSLPDWVRPSG